MLLERRLPPSPVQQRADRHAERYSEYQPLANLMEAGTDRDAYTGAECDAYAEAR